MTDSMVRDISLDLIDDPVVAMRENIDDEQMDELMVSMREIGLIQAITLNKVGDRYEVIAGHRRSRAARLLGWVSIKAEVLEVDSDTAFSMRIAENLIRKDVDPVDEASFVGEIMLKFHKSEAEVAKLLKRSEQWVADRVAVFEMPEYIQVHLKQKRYPLGAALWLARIPNENTRTTYANWAGANGVSVAGAKQWYDLEMARPEPFVAGEVVIQDNPGAPQVIRKTTKCAICKKDVFLDEAIAPFIHSGCCAGPP